MLDEITLGAVLRITDVQSRSTVNRQKRIIFTVNRQMSEPKLAVKFLF